MQIFSWSTSEKCQMLFGRKKKIIIIIIKVINKKDNLNELSFSEKKINK